MRRHQADPTDARKRQPGSALKTAPNGSRVIATHTDLFTDAVKPPAAKGAARSASFSALQAFLKGTP